ncbi:MAG: hypothetical protein MJA30_07580, partial [Cytophagales bacterium]|nr:hypothetical protein [Cytophagales bacterium]
SYIWVLDGFSAGLDGSLFFPVPFLKSAVCNKQSATLYFFYLLPFCLLPTADFKKRIIENSCGVWRGDIQEQRGPFEARG